MPDILAAAEQSIRRFGIRKTSMGDVASAAKVSRATLYNYFSDKEELISAVLNRAGEQFCKAAEQEVAKYDNLLEKITQAIIWCRQQSNSDLFLNISETEPETAAMMALNGTHIESCMDFWPSHVQKAMNSGEISSTLDCDQAADWIQRVILSMVLFPGCQLELDNPKQLKTHLEQFLFSGFRS
nr:TetR/AcrR family transcriptional regulator [Endozoicomonas sp. OPT23]